MVREKILSNFVELLSEKGIEKKPEDLSNDLVLLESGLDSLGFAILVVKLEEQLEYDPFTLMDEPFYPRTLGDFVEVYEKYKPK